MAHEHMHGWIPYRIGRLPDDEARDYWFSEGFADYLSHRLLVSAGLWTLDDYAAALSRVVYEHAVSSVRTLPNAEAAKRFWTDAEAQRLPYLRGELLALFWARRLDTHGTSLEAALRGLVMTRPPGDPGLATERLMQVMTVQLGHHAERDFQAHIVRGGVVPIDRRLLGPCFDGALVDRGQFELGMDPSSFSSRSVTGVVPGSRAEEAGLRNGQRIEGASVRFGDADKPARFTVLVDGERREITYLPATRETVTVMAFATKPAAAEHPECKAWIALGVPASP